MWVPSGVTLAPAPRNEQPAGSAAKFAGATAGSRTQRVSAPPVPPALSVAATVTWTSTVYQALLPLGPGGLSEIVVVGAIPSLPTLKELDALSVLLPALSYARTNQVWVPLLNAAGLRSAV